MSRGLRDHLEAIYDQHGRLTPALVVDEARDPAHPLHDQVFDKSVEDAAEVYYRDRAHTLIQAVRIEGKPEIRAFMAVRRPTEENGGMVYEPTEKVAQDPVARQVVLAEMERDWRTLKSRWEGFAEFAEMVSADLAKAA